MFSIKGFYISASGAIQGHHDPLVNLILYLSYVLYVEGNKGNENFIQLKRQIYCTGNTRVSEISLAQFTYFKSCMYSCYYWILYQASQTFTDKNPSDGAEEANYHL